MHQLPAYAAIYEAAYPEKMAARAAVLESETGAVIYPFMLRIVEIGGERAYVDGRPALDIATPYGFGGPISSSDNPALYRQFTEKFTEYCRQHDFASEFMCPHPFTGTLDLVHSDSSYSIEEGKPTVFIDLDGDENTIRSQLNRGHKSAVNHARKSGVRVEQINPDAALYTKFNAIYMDTMDRHGAADRWYHPQGYFQQCRDMLGKKHCSFFTASVQGHIAAWFIILHGFSTAYYHFAGSVPDFARIKASQLLMHEVSLWCREQGYRRLFLGGGVSAKEDDSLLRYKLGFSKNAVRHVTAWRILHEGNYRTLSELKQYAERKIFGDEPQRDYFPLYRR